MLQKIALIIYQTGNILLYPQLLAKNPLKAIYQLHPKPECQLITFLQYFYDINLIFSQESQQECVQFAKDEICLLEIECHLWIPCIVIQVKIWLDL